MKPKMLFLRIGSFLFCAWMFFGCGDLYRINYSNIRADLIYSGSRSVAIGVLDQRPYVLNGEKDPKYVGTMRGGYGNPFDLFTQSDLRLVEDMSVTLADSLRSRGFQVAAVKAEVGKDAANLLAELSAGGAERILFLDVKDWWSDYYPASWGPERTELIMNIELKVMNPQRQVLASSRIETTENPPSGWPKDTIPGFYQKKMAVLLNDPSIQKALR
ncbi:MAG: hypothetical protein ACOZF0_22500 [Thermodesulfobacteriota bacterium]